MTTTENAQQAPESTVVNGAEALASLAVESARGLGDGLVDQQGETNGQLDGQVLVRRTTVLGEAGYAVTMGEGGTATIWLDDGRAPIHQLQALTTALLEHCISPYALLR